LPDDREGADLRHRALESGMFLAFRSGAGMLLGLVGILLLTRRIGSDAYGVYAGALGVLVFLQSLAQWGVNTYLLRAEPDDLDRAAAVAQTVTLAGAAVSAILGLVSLPLLARWLDMPDFPRVAGVLFLGLPLVAVGQVPLMLLERQLAYRAVATIELAGQAIFYVVALLLAWRGAGVWAPVAGWWAQYVLLSVLLFGAAHLRPHLIWDARAGEAMVRNGLTLTAATWVWSLRALVNPLVVGHFVGASGVGQVAIAIRITEVIGFVRTAAWRIGLSVFGRFRKDKERLRMVLSEAMHAQVLVLGAVFVVFAVAAPVGVPLILGPAWAPVARVFPFVALGYLVNAVFSLHTAALYMVGRNPAVVSFHLLHVALFAGTALLLVPRAGVIGYGYAEVVALLSYVLVHYHVARRIGAPRTLLPLSWGIASAVAMFYADLGVLALAGLVVLPMLPTHRRALAGLVRDVRAARIRF
jgi:O-antigen/teichoic acid export membrane protein